MPPMIVGCCTRTQTPDLVEVSAGPTGTRSTAVWEEGRKGRRLDCSTEVAAVHPVGM